MDHEGYNVAKWLSDHGVAAFVLKYRLAREKASTYTIEGSALADMRRAIRLVRSQSSEWGLNPEHIGVMGFSAGGEVAALGSTRYDPGISSAADPLERESSKPGFQALLYPAIPHDMTLSKQTPPAFLACREDDRQDIAQGLQSSTWLSNGRACRQNFTSTPVWDTALGSGTTMDPQCLSGRSCFWNGSSAECISRKLRVLERD